MNDQLITTYMVELLYKSKPQVNAPELLDQLRKRCGNVEQIGKTPEVYLYAFQDHVMAFQDGNYPAQLFLAFPNKGENQIDVQEALQQSWGWPESKTVVANCKTTLLLTEMTAQGLEYKTRLVLFHNVLEAVLTVAPCEVIHWVPSQQMINPSVYLAMRQKGEFHPLLCGINVRLYSVTNGEENEKLMDTMGLGTLGLPDLQCHFKGLEPRDVAGVLYDTAYYLFDNGDVIETGHTLKGIQDVDKWKCQREYSMINPKRDVLDINPGEPFAAGNPE